MYVCDIYRHASMHAIYIDKHARMYAHPCALGNVTDICLCTWMYVFTYGCMHLCMLCVCVCVYVCIYTNKYVYTYIIHTTRIHALARARTHTHTHTHYMYAWYIFTYKHTHLYIRENTHTNNTHTQTTHTQTHTHTNARALSLSHWLAQDGTTRVPLLSKIIALCGAGESPSSAQSIRVGD